MSDFFSNAIICIKEPNSPKLPEKEIEIDENIQCFRKKIAVDHIKHIEGPGDIPLTTSIKDKKCWCDAKDLFNYGCRCHGAVA